MAVATKRAVQTLLIILLFMATAVSAATPVEFMDDYLKQLYSGLKQLDDSSLGSTQKLKLQSKLVNGKGYWIMKHGNPGRAANLVGLMYSKKPTSWKIIPKKVHDKFALLYVDFSMPEFTGHGWRTELDLIRIGGRWQVRSFTDITRRPLPPGSDIKTVLDGYFTSAINAAESLYSDKLSKKKKQSVNMVYGLGAGYWIGQLQRKDLPAGSMFTYFISQRPTTWNIEEPRIAGAYAEAKVEFISKPRHGDPVSKTYTFELNQDRGEWFLVNHRSKKVKSDPAPKVEPTLVTQGDSPEVLAQKQLDLLVKKGVKMGGLAEASKPLWLKNGRAKRGMGRLIGMAMGMLGKEKDSTQLKISNTKIDGDTAQVIVAAEWPQAVTIKPFSRIQLYLQQTDDGWRLADAQILLK